MTRYLAVLWKDPYHDAKPAGEVWIEIRIDPTKTTGTNPTMLELAE